MERVGLLLLLFGIIPMTHTETLHVTVNEKNIVVLKCGKVNKGNVTWSRDINGERVDILTISNGKITKHIPDSLKRYGSGENPVLSIFKVTQSDTGKYYCNGAPVELSVIPRTEFSGTSTEEQSEGIQTNGHGIWKFLVAVVAGSCLSAVASVLLIWIYYSKKKGQSDIESLYAEVPM